MARADRRARTCSLAELVVLTRHASAPRAVRSRYPESATLDKPLIRECLFYPTYEPLAMLLGSGLCVARTPRLPRIQTLDREKLRKSSVQLQSKTGLSSLSRKIDTICAVWPKKVERNLHLFIFNEINADASLRSVESLSF